MSKILKTALIFVFLFSIYITSNAETMNLYNDVTNEETSSNTTNSDPYNNVTQNEVADNDIESDEEPNDDLDLLDDSNYSNPYARTSTPSPTSINTARVNTLSSVSEANLGLNNILCVILIAIGILMILLAIAILIRLKK